MNRAKPVGDQKAANVTKKPSKVANFLQNHQTDAISSLRKLLQLPWSTLSTVFVIATALLLPACLLVLNKSLESAVESFRSGARITLYLSADTNPGRGHEVSINLLEIEGVVGSEYISSEAALEEFSSATGLSSVLAELTDNPLPAAIVITPSQPDLGLITQLSEQFALLPEVESIQVDESWIARAEAIAASFGFLGQSLGLIFAIGVSFIIGNAVRMSVVSRQDEIRVIKLVGGSDGFIARPLLYTGIWFGIAGALLTALVLLLLVAGANSALQATADLLPGLRLQGPGIDGLLLLLGSGGALGWLSARISSFYYIRAIGL